MDTAKINHPENWDSELYDSKITLVLTPPHGGWIDLLLIGTPRGALTEVNFSYWDDSFQDFVEWMCAIARGDLPAHVTVDAEGIEYDFSASRTKDRPEWLELQISRTSYVDENDEDTNDEPLPETLYLSRVERRQLLHEFYRRFDQWCRDDYEPQEWHRSGCKDDQHRICADPLTFDVSVLVPFAQKQNL